MDGTVFERRIRAAITLGLALGSSACGPTIPNDGEPGESTGVSSTSGSSSSSTTGAVSTSGATSGTPVTTDDMRLDLGGGGSPSFDLGSDSSVCNPAIDPPACDVKLEPEYELRPLCFTLEQGQSCDTIPDDAVIEQVWDCLACDGFPEGIECEPFEVGQNSCCRWVVIAPGQSCPGRPFIVEGTARVPPTVDRPDWARPCHPALHDMDAHARSVLAQAWAAEAAHEAASVASFSRFVLQLISLGAPPQLLTRAQAAIADEVEHSRIFYGLAAAYGGAAVGPGPLPIEGALADAGDPVGCAVSACTEGCIAETISALQLAVAATKTQDASTRALLERVAEDELRHAELAWAAVAWMLRRGDANMRSAVANAFLHATESVPRAVSRSDHLDPDTLHRCGRLTADERLEVAQRALEQCIAPAASALLEPWTTLSPAARAPA